MAKVIAQHLNLMQKPLRKGCKPVAFSFRGKCCGCCLAKRSSQLLTLRSWFCVACPPREGHPEAHRADEGAAQNGPEHQRGIAGGRPECRRLYWCQCVGYVERNGERPVNGPIMSSP